MAIHLSPFSPERAPRQALDLRRFVKSQDQDWLSAFYSGIATRNRDLPHSLYNVVRLAWSTAQDGERYSYLIRDRGETNRVIGAATIILNGAVYSPVEQGAEIHAHDVDYVARSDTPLELHWAIGGALAARTLQLVQSGIHPQDSDATLPPYSLMATINPEDPHPSIGLLAIPGMEAVGSPAVLEVVGGGDYHQLDKGRVPLQLYVSDPAH